MSEDSAAYRTLRQVVASFLNRSSLDAKFIEKYLAIAVEVLTELNIFHVHCPKVAYLDISEANLVSLPNDYIDFIKPPSIVVNGHIWTLTEDELIPIPTELDCGNIKNPQPDNFTTNGKEHGILNDFLNTTPNTAWGYSLGTSGGVNVCYYRIDKRKRLIILKGHIRGGKLLLEYTSSGVSMDGTTVIPRELVPTIREYLNWQSLKYNSKNAMGLIEMAKKDYEDQLNLFTRFHASLSADQFLDIFYGESRQTPKR